MKLAPLLLLPLLTSPVMAESIGDRSNRQAYEDAQTVNWNPEPEYTPRNNRRDNWFTKTYHQEENYRRNNWWWQKHLATNSYQPGYSSSSTCTRKEYREEYVPGTSHRPGYVRTWHDEVEVPCHRPSHRPSPPRERIPSPDGNECSEGAILGGILGGGAGAALSRGDGRWWAIPLGAVIGSHIGCEAAGG